jgi:hypothetical protein
VTIWLRELTIFSDTGVYVEPCRVLYPKGITNAMWKTTCSKNKHHFKMVFILSVSIEEIAHV